MEMKGCVKPCDVDKAKQDAIQNRACVKPVNKCAGA